MIQVVAFDPGKTTGVCIIEGTLEGYDVAQHQVEFQQVGHLFEQWRRETSLTSYCTVVCESFTINNQTARNSQAPWSLEVIGIIRYFCAEMKVELVFQQPSAAKNLIKDSVIKNAGMWKPGADHAMDATRHALYFLATSKGVMRECLVQSLPTE